MYIGNGMIVNAENPSARHPRHRPVLHAVRRRRPSWLTRRLERVEGRPPPLVGGRPFAVPGRLSVGVVVWLTQHDSTYHAPLDGRPAPHIDQSGATSLLDDLQTAVRRDDVTSGAALGPHRRRGRTWVASSATAVRLHVADFSLRYVDASGAVAPDGTWAADVATTWRFAGFDDRTERLEVRVRFARAGDRLRIAGIGGGDHRTPLWLSGPVQVRRSARSMVVVDGSAEQAGRFAALARRAVPQVRRVLPGWPGGLVVEVPASQAGLDAALGAHPGDYDGIAAVTTTVDGSRSRRSPSHVFINPQVFDPLRPRGAQVVITHEATHVATDAATSAAPIWLVEGFADFVALSSQRLPLTTTAARIIALVRRSGAPGHLPGPREFRAGAKALEARYESAWLACRLLDGAGGDRRAGRLLPGDGPGRLARPRAAAVVRSDADRLHPAVADPPVTLAGVSERRWSLVTLRRRHDRLRAGRGLADPVASGPRRYSWCGPGVGRVHGRADRSRQRLLAIRRATSAGPRSWSRWW